MAYAAWRKCDFQVHSPRDPNWQGERPLGVDVNNDATGNAATVDEVKSSREAWASAFVDKCLEKGLQAVAITDHHELVMVPYVQNKIKARHESGQECDIWVFPGMELTAHGRVQALIIFDAELPEDWWKQAQGKLGIVYANLAVNSSRSQRVTQLACNYADISSELDTIEGLRGKYIVLPNVSQGNNHTVLTDGAHADFLRMPYVGGYLDRGQTINTLGARNKRRMSGDDRTWSDRKIYPLPTSDARSSTYEHLGSNNTWIKIAEPTAEAIRQAFLAHESRITIENPSLPSLWVSHVCVEGSDILEETNILLSPELNSVIGGRGSGKSSFLEYLSFGVGRSSYDVPQEHYSGTERLQGLIKDSLVTQGGRVTVNLIQDNAVFQIRRDSSTAYQPQITYPNGDTQPVSLAELRSLFPAVVYSQGELAEIGKQTGTKTKLVDLLQFVNPDYKREDDALLADIEYRKELVRSSLKAL
jgi:type III restriction enzyme